MRSIELIKNASSIANEQMVNCKTRDEFIFFSGMYSGLATMYLQITQNISNDIACLSVNDYVYKIAKGKIFVDVKNSPS